MTASQWWRAGGLNESATAYYKPEQEGAQMGDITVGAGDADYLTLKGFYLTEGVFIFSSGTSPNVASTPKCSTATK